MTPWLALMAAAQVASPADKANEFSFPQLLFFCETKKPEAPFVLLMMEAQPAGHNWLQVKPLDGKWPAKPILIVDGMRRTIARKIDDGMSYGFSANGASDGIDYKIDLAFLDRKGWPLKVDLHLISATDDLATTCAIAPPPPPPPSKQPR